MNPLRSTSPKANYFAAFFLGALIALLLNWPARAAGSNPPLPAGSESPSIMR